MRPGKTKHGTNTVQQEIIEDVVRDIFSRVTVFRILYDGIRLDACPLHDSGTRYHAWPALDVEASRPIHLSLHRLRSRRWPDGADSPCLIYLVSIIDRYIFSGAPMSSNTDTSTAGFLVGRRREAACLPKETIFESTEGCLGEPDDKVIREPMATRPFGVEAWWTKMRSYDDVPFPDIDDDRLIEPHDSIGFD